MKPQVRKGGVETRCLADSFHPSTSTNRTSAPSSAPAVATIATLLLFGATCALRSSRRALVRRLRSTPRGLLLRLDPWTCAAIAEQHRTNQTCAPALAGAGAGGGAGPAPGE